MTPKALSGLVVLGAFVFGGRAVASSPEVVSVEVRGPDDTRALYESSLREVVGRVGLAVREGASAPSPDVLAAVTIDTSLPDEVRVVVADGRTGKVVLERDLSSAQGSNVAREDAVLVVRSVLDALLDKERRSPPPPPDPPLAAAPSPAPAVTNPPPSPRRGASFDVAPFARVGSFASGQGAIFGGGAAARVDLSQGPWHPSVTLLGAVNAPQSVATDGVDARATVVPVRGVVAIAIADAGGWGIDTGVGLGADIVALSVTHAPPGPPIAPPGVAVDPAGTAMLSGHAPLTRFMALEAAVGVDADLASSRFVVDHGGAHDALYAPLGARAWATLGVSFRLAGPERAP